jgi:hypothetical protein
VDGWIDGRVDDDRITDMWNRHFYAIMTIALCMLSCINRLRFQEEAGQGYER